MTTTTAPATNSSPPIFLFFASRIRSDLLVLLLMLLFLVSSTIVSSFSVIPINSRRGRKQNIPVIIVGDNSNNWNDAGCKIPSIGKFSSLTTDDDTRRPNSSLKAGLFGEQDPVYNQNVTYISADSDWQIYIDQSKASLDRGGGATFDAFFSLCDNTDNTDDDSPANDNESNDVVKVQVIPAILPKPASGGKGPWIRCIWNTNNKNNNSRPSPNLDVSNVNSVDKVYRVLTKHLGVKNISREACECLKWKYKGNTYLESGEMKPAIDSYNQALSICEDSIPNNSNANNAIILQQQEGIILLLRASAFLQQAQLHKEVLQTAIAGDKWKLPSSQVLQELLSGALSSESPSSLSSSSNIVEDSTVTTATASKDGGATVNGDGDGDTDDERSPSSSVNGNGNNDEYNDNDPQTAIRLSMLRKLQRNGVVRKVQLRKIQYRHGLYQTSLLQAARDSLRATEVLPNYSTAWLRAGELLSDLWKIKESKQYYEKALSIDESLEESVGSILQGLEARQELVDQARANKDWPEDSVQLALDIAG